MSRRRNRSRQAFTLIELLAVIGIIVVLVGIVMAGAMYAGKAADKARCKTQMAMIQTALDRYAAAFTRYPTNIMVGAVFSHMASFVPDLTNRMSWQTNTMPSGPKYIAILDPWSQPIHYQKYKDDTCELRSLGPDGKSNTVDDIISSRGD